ncbi:unnamed protein product [Sympodiomycopsis kandeliae]
MKIDPELRNERRGEEIGQESSFRWESGSHRGLILSHRLRFELARYNSNSNRCRPQRRLYHIHPFECAHQYERPRR